ncbi:MAG: hypothetical protein ACJ789_21225 [Thermomicrobiales bacterium]
MSSPHGSCVPPMRNPLDRLVAILAAIAERLERRAAEEQEDGGEDIAA